jgi:hypothetical protein
MRLTIAAAAAATAFVFAAPSYSAEVYKDYVPSKEVYDMNFVHVTPGRLADYLDGLKLTWLSSCELQKKYGAAIDCVIYASSTMANRDFNLILVMKRPSAAMSDPDEKRYNAITTELHKQLAEDKQKKLVQSYEEMRTMFGQQEFRQLTFK